MPPKYKIKQAVLNDFATTVEAKPDLTQQEVFVKFPEFKNDSGLLQVAYDYYETSKTGKYGTIEELNSKFPELEFPVIDQIKEAKENAYYMDGETDFLEKSHKKPVKTPVQITEEEKQVRQISFVLNMFSLAGLSEAELNHANTQVKKLMDRKAAERYGKEDAYQIDKMGDKKYKNVVKEP